MLGLFGRMPAALAPKGTRLSLKMPAAFPKVNRRMRCREEKPNFQTNPKPAQKKQGIQKNKKMKRCQKQRNHNADQREVFHAAKGSISCNRRLYFTPRRGISSNNPAKDGFHLAKRDFTPAGPGFHAAEGSTCRLYPRVRRRSPALRMTFSGPLLFRGRIAH